MKLSDTWQSEFTRFHGMSPCDQMGWLAYLSYWLSMFARDTYDVGTEKLADPRRLRIYNEFLHRLATQQSAIYRHSPQRIPDDILFQFIEDNVTLLDINEAILVDKMSSLSVREGA